MVCWGGQLWEVLKNTLISDQPTECIYYLLHAYTVRIISLSQTWIHRFRKEKDIFFMNADHNGRKSKSTSYGCCWSLNNRKNTFWFGSGHLWIRQSGSCVVNLYSHVVRLKMSHFHPKLLSVFHLRVSSHTLEGESSPV